MSEPQHTPTRREKMKPLELLVMAGVFGIFVGAFTFMGIRGWSYPDGDGWVLPLIMGAVAFVVSLVVIATLLIAVGPKIDDRVDPVDPDAPSGGAGSVHRDPNTHGH